MISHDINIRVRYAETDKMGYVYYGNYATYFEIARVETFRMLGISYKEMEDEGVMMPVLNYSVEFKKPAFYDENLLIRTFIKEKPGVRISFDYEVYNEKSELINTASTNLVFVDVRKNKPTRPPKKFEVLTEKYFS